MSAHAAELNGSLAARARPCRQRQCRRPVAADAARVRRRDDYGQVTGARDAPHIEAEAKGDERPPDGPAARRRVARFSGIVAGPQTSGEAELSGTLDGTPLAGAADLSPARMAPAGSTARPQRRRKPPLGDLAIGGDGFSRAMSRRLPRPLEVAPLFLVEAGGMLRADVALSAGRAPSPRPLGTATDMIYEM